MKVLPLNGAVYAAKSNEAYNNINVINAGLMPCNAGMAALSYSMPVLGNYTGLSFAPSFGAKLEVFKANKPEIKEGLEALGKEEMVLIIHGGSFPSTSKTDTGFGNPNSTGAKNLIDFISGVFTGIQLGPNGKTKECDSSPYMGTLFSANPLFIDLEQLTGDAWGNILPKEDFNKIVLNNKQRGRASTNYSYIYKEQDKALRTAYDNFFESKAPAVKELKKEFEEYKKADENDPWLDNDALYEALSKKHNMDYWPLWEDELDKNLIGMKDTKEGKERIKQLRKDYAYEIDFYKFVQFAYSKQIAETKKYANSKNVKFIADKQVALSDRDNWAYQNLFLNNWKLGCPPDYFAAEGQAWGFSVLNPKKLFNEDGSLGEAGEIIKKSIIKVFKEYNSLRIDHYIGLVDPWVYPEGKTPMSADGAGRLYSSTENPSLKEYSNITDENIDIVRILENTKHGLAWSENDYVDGATLTEEQIDKYARYIDKIVLAAAREAIAGSAKELEALEKAAKSPVTKKAQEAKRKLEEIDKKARNSLIVEDLGAMTTPAAIVMHKRGLNGIKVAQFMDGGSKDSPYLPTAFNNKGEENYWYIAGSHDNEPLSLWAKRLVKQANTTSLRKQDVQKRENAKNQIEYIADYLYGSSKDYEAKKEKMYSDPKFLMQSVYAMMLKSPAKNIQIFFADLFGDTRVYNKPGTPSDFNWKTRPRNDFEKQYDKALDNGMAFDFVSSIETAIKSREQDEIN